MPKTPRWLHPIHARGVRSAGIPTIKGKRLTDKRITALIKQGAYGDEARSALLALEQSKKKPTTRQLNNNLFKKLGLKL